MLCVTFLPWVALTVWSSDVACGCQPLFSFFLSFFPFSFDDTHFSLVAFRLKFLWLEFSPGNSQLPINLAQAWQKRGSRKWDMKSVQDGSGVKEWDSAGAALTFPLKFILESPLLLWTLLLTKMSDCYTINCYTMNWSQCIWKSDACKFFTSSLIILATISKHKF